MDKESIMKILVKQWKESGLTRQAFAQQHNITYRSLEYWCRKGKKSQKGQDILSNPPSFIELLDNSKTIPTNRQAQIELELASGVRIKIY